MAPSFLFRLFLKAFRKEVLRAAYAGILEREPDSGGLAAHAARLGKNGNLAPILAEISQSKEAWANALKSHADAIVHQLHDALREGDAQPDELAEWTGRLQATADVAAIAASIAQGRLHWRKLARLDPTVLVTAAFSALLGRDPDIDGLATYTNLLKNTGNMTLLLAEIGTSIEHRTRVLEQVDSTLDADAASDAMPSIDQEALITAAFRGLLGREPDAEAMTAYKDSLQRNGDVAGFLAELGQSNEHRKRLLLRRG